MAESRKPAPPPGQNPGPPLAGHYPVTLGIAVVSLIPFIVVSTAAPLFQGLVGAQLHITRGSLEIIAGLSMAGYAFGALLGGDLTQRFSQRVLFLLSEGLFIGGTATILAAGGEAAYGAGRVVEGFSTGLLLVIALPPVIRNFPAKLLPITAAAVNVGFFGATTVGPLLGGWVAAGHAWRWFFAALAAIGAIVLGLAVMTLPDEPPPSPGKRFDVAAVLLGLGGTALPFWATGELTITPFHSRQFQTLLMIGLGALVVLILAQYHEEEPLAPVKPMWSVIPLVGTLVAMFGGSAFIVFLELAEEFALRGAHQTPLAAGLSFWPQAPAVLAASVLLGWVVNTRWLPVFTLAGMILLIAAGVLLMSLGSAGAGVVSIAALLLGLGAGATVAPGLWLAAFSLPSKMVGRTLALVELVRSEADFILAPILLRVARNASRPRPLTAAGAAQAAEWMLWILVAITAFCVGYWLLRRVGLPQPDLEGWIGKNRKALPTF